METKLSYEDLRFYRSIARSELRKERAARKKLEAEQAKNNPKPAQSQKQGWVSWAWSGVAGTANATGQQEEVRGEDGMTDKQRKELYDAIDYDETDDVWASTGGKAGKDTITLQVYAQLRKGSLAIVKARSQSSKTPSSGQQVISVIFDDFDANVVQRGHESIEATLSLGSMHVPDGTTPKTRYPEIIRVKGSEGSRTSAITTPAATRPPSPSLKGRKPLRGASLNHEPFFFVKFEHKPLDERADDAITLKMKAMEVIYHRGYVEAIYEFFEAAGESARKCRGFTCECPGSLINLLSSSNARTFTECRERDYRRA